MTNYLWDDIKNTNCGDLPQLLKITVSKFIDQMKATVDHSPFPESQELIQNDSMERFNNLSSLLAGILSVAYNFSEEDNNNNAKKLNAWIILGSLTESALQIFLAFYIDDYKNTRWQQWDNVDIETVKNTIIKSIDNLTDQNILQKDQAKSLKEAVKDKIKEHTKEHKVQKVMLDELINLYRSLELMENDELDYLKQIQSNRNGIHSFEKRNIGTWDDLQNCVRFFCYLLEWILNHLPDIPDYEPFFDQFLDYNNLP